MKKTNLNCYRTKVRRTACPACTNSVLHLNCIKAEISGLTKKGELW